MSSAVCFSLDQSKILSSSNWLIVPLADLCSWTDFSAFNFCHFLTFCFVRSFSDPDWEGYLENTEGKGKIAYSRAIFPFPTVFSTHLENFLPISPNLKLLSANSISLEESKCLKIVVCEMVKTLHEKQKMLLNSIFCFLPSFSPPSQIPMIDPFPNKLWFLRVCSTSLLKTLWEKEKLLVTSNFSLSRSVFSSFRELSAIYNKREIVVCKLFQFRAV